MKVLYALANYPQLSESYIEAEIAFALRSGVEVEVWSQYCNNPSVPIKVRVHRNLLIDAISEFKPDVVHTHYLVFPRRYDWDLGKVDVPMTVRGHSFEFSTAAAADAVSIPRVEKVYLFPHFARMVPHEKVVALPVAYDSSLHRPAESKRQNLVLRLAAGKAGKGLDDVFAVAKLCPDHEFVMGVAEVHGHLTFFNQLCVKNVGLARPVKLMKDVPQDKAVQLTAQAGIYLDTSDPKSHPFGMPISIVESLATGSTVLIRDSMPAREYAGDAAFYYSTPEEAAQTIKMVLGWTPEIRARQRERALLQAELYADRAVLPRLIHDWEEIAKRRR